MLKMRPFCMLLPTCLLLPRDLDKAKCMNFLIKGEKLLEKYNEIWKKFSNIINKEFDSKPLCNEKYLKT